MTVTDIVKLLYLKDRRAWRTWLAANHRKCRAVWLVYGKSGTGRPSIPYGDSVEEALCFGWVDSIIKRLDDERYLRKFTPRADAARWSAANIARARRLIASG